MRQLGETEIHDCKGNAVDSHRITAENSPKSRSNDRFAAGRRVRAQVRDDEVGKAHVAEEDVLLQLAVLAARRLLPRLFKALLGEPGEDICLGRRPHVERRGLRALRDQEPAQSTRNVRGLLRLFLLRR